MATAKIPSASQDYTVTSITYTVPSSDPSKAPYTVICSPSDGRVLDCNCPHRAHGRKTACRHMKLIGTRDHGGIRPRIKIQMRCHEAAPATAPAPAPSFIRADWFRAPADVISRAERRAALADIYA